MTNEEMKERRTNIQAKGELYAKGYCAALHAVAGDLLDDLHELGDELEAKQQVLAGYLRDLSRELSKTAEQLRP